jgi:hypothetical protein
LFSVHARSFKLTVARQRNANHHVFEALYGLKTMPSYRGAVSRS